MALRELFTPHYSKEVIIRMLDRGLTHAEEDVYGSPGISDNLWGGDAELYALLMKTTVINAELLHPEFLDDPTLPQEYTELWRNWIASRRERINNLFAVKRAAE